MGEIREEKSEGKGGVVKGKEKFEREESRQKENMAVEEWKIRVGEGNMRIGKNNELRKGKNGNS